MKLHYKSVKHIILDDNWNNAWNSIGNNVAFIIQLNVEKEICIPLNMNVGPQIKNYIRDNTKDKC